MIKLALIGKNIQHSKSKEIYESILSKKIQYDLLDYESIDDIPNIQDLLNEYEGISVTSPYKTFMYKKLNIEEKPTGLKMINTLTLKADQIVGFNSDYLALKDIIRTMTTNVSTNWYILGDGNMSLTVQKILDSQKHNIYSRKLGNLNSLEDSLKSDDIIINTCSRNYDIDLALPQNIQFLDLNYDTTYEDKLKQSGINYISGRVMLKKQAEYAVSFWNLK